MPDLKVPGLGVRAMGGSVKADATIASLVDEDAAYMEFDAVSSSARFGAKGNGAAVSRGLTLRTLNAGVAVNAVVIAADGSMTLGSTTIPAGKTLSLGGATIAGAPTWASNQALTLSTAAQPNVTSLGTLTSLAVSGASSLQAATAATALVTGLPAAFNDAEGAYVAYNPATGYAILGPKGTGAVTRNLVLRRLVAGATSDVMTFDAAGATLNQNLVATAGITVSAGGITVQAGTSALQALTLAGALTLPASPATPSLVGPLAANNVVVPTATATTLLAVGSYLNYNDALLVVGGDSVNAVFAVLVLRTGNANPVLQVLNATGCSFALSGGNLQVTQTTGASQTYTARALRVTGI